MSEKQDMCIGPWRIDEPMHRLIGPDRTVSLEPRAMKTLLYLYENRGRPVSRDELLDKVWGKKALTDHAISVVMTSLRQALEDDAHNPKYLKTIRKKGYCLMAETTQNEVPENTVVSSGSSGKYTNPFKWAAALILGILALYVFQQETFDDPNIGVSVHLNPILEDEGTSKVKVANDLLLMELARYGTVSMEPAFEAGGVINISGSLKEKSGQQHILLTVVENGVSSEILSDPLAENVDQIARAVRTLVASVMAGNSVIAPKTTARNEIDIVLDRARYFWGFHRHDRNQLAYRMVRRLMAEFPSNGDVHAMLAEMYAALPGAAWGLEGVDTFDLAEQHLQRAVELGADAKYIWRTRARIIQEREQDFVRAAQFYRKALDHDPEDYWNWRSMAVSLAINGKFDEALKAHDQAISLSLEPTGALSEKAITLYFAGQFQEAAALRKELADLDGRPGVRSALIYYMAGDHQASFEEWQQYFTNLNMPSVAQRFSDPIGGSVSEIYREVAFFLSEEAAGQVSPILETYMWMAAGEPAKAAAILSHEFRKYEERRNSPDYDPRSGRTFMFMRIDPFVKLFEHEEAVATMLQKLQT